MLLIFFGEYFFDNLDLIAGNAANKINDEQVRVEWMSLVGCIY
jgi:hypothetical protein